MKRCLGFWMKDGVYIAGEWYPAKGKAVWETDEKKVFPCVPVSEHEAYKEKVTDLVIMEINDLIEWGIQEQAENNVYQKSIDELNEDWLDKIRKLKHNLFSFGLNQSELSSEELKKKELGLSEKAVVEKCVQHKDGRGFTYNEN